MKLFKFIFFVMLCALSVMLSVNYTNARNIESNVTLKKILAIAADDEVQCNKKHVNGCHSGGKYATSCGIGLSFHICIGGAGGDCTISCGGNTYACCGLDCSCVEANQF